MCQFFLASNPNPADCAQYLISARRSFECRDIELDHFQHRIANAFGLGLVGIGVEFEHPLRRNLPGHAIFVLEPATLFGRTAFEQRLPIMVNLVLRIARDYQRDGMIEGSIGPALMAMKG